MSGTYLAANSVEEAVKALADNPDRPQLRHARAFDRAAPGAGRDHHQAAPAPSANSAPAISGPQW